MTYYAQAATRPSLDLWLFDTNWTLIDLSAGYSFSSRLGDRGVAAVKEKTTGFVGAVGSGRPGIAGAIPNLRITWSPGDLDVTPDEYELMIICDAGGGNNPRYFFTNLEIGAIILAPA